MAIRKNKQLNAILQEHGEVTLGMLSFRIPFKSLLIIRSAGGGTSLHSPVYNLLAADLRKAPTTTLEPVLTSPTDGSSPLLDLGLPTLILFECVLAYILPAQSTNLVTWFAERFESSGRLGVVVYEVSFSTCANYRRSPDYGSIRCLA